MAKHKDDLQSRLRAAAPAPQPPAPVAPPPAAPMVEVTEKTLPGIAPAPPTQVVERFFEVERETRVSQGASYYTLPRGKVLSSKGYDVDALLAMGVPLKQVDRHRSPSGITVL